jgi:hypothetical protein
MGYIRSTQNIYCKNLDGGDHVEDLGVDWRIIIKYTFKKYSVKVWTGQDKVQWQSYVISFSHVVGEFG